MKYVRTILVAAVALVGVGVAMGMDYQPAPPATAPVVIAPVRPSFWFDDGTYTVGTVAKGFVIPAGVYVTDGEGSRMVGYCGFAVRNADGSVADVDWGVAGTDKPLGFFVGPSQSVEVTNGCHWKPKA